MTDADLHADRLAALTEAESIMLAVLGYLPDETGDAGHLRQRIREWLARVEAMPVTPYSRTTT